MDIEYAADALWAEIKRGNHLPAAWRGKLSMVQAYAVQIAILRRIVAEGDTQAGWKVGLTSAAMRAQHGIAEPCFGYLLGSGHLASGVVLEYGSLIAPAVENELCLTLGATLRGPGVSYAHARHAISAIEPALEISETRGDYSADTALSTTDNAQQKAFVTGAASAFRADIALAEASVEVHFNGRLRATASGAEVMGDPIHAIVWLANKLSDHGIGLERGMRVMSGSFTQQFTVGRGDLVVAAFDPFGQVEARFA